MKFHKIVVLFLFLISSLVFSVDQKNYEKAIRDGNLPKVKTMIQQGANPSYILTRGRKRSTLGVAIASYQFKVIDYLLKKGASPNSGYGGWTPLHWAVHRYPGWERQFYQVALKLLKKGANPNFVPAFTYDGSTALMKAAGGGHRKLIRLFIKNGASKSKKDKKGRNAGDYAKENGHIQLANYLWGRSNRSYQKTLMYAVKNNNLKRVKKLIGSKRSRRARQKLLSKTEGKVRYTALHWAAQKGHYQIARFLIKKGANVNAKSMGSFTPLMVAAAYKQTKVANMLIRSGKSDINVVQSSGCATGYTALHWAIQNNMFSTVKLLIRYRVNFRASRSPYWPARSKIRMVKLLAKAGLRPPRNFMAWLDGKVSSNYPQKHKWYYKQYKKIFKYLNQSFQGMSTVFSSSGRAVKNPFESKRKKSSFEPFDIKRTY